MPPEKATDMPKIPTTPLSYGDAQPILQNLAGRRRRATGKARCRLPITSAPGR